MKEIRFRGKRVDNGEWVYGGVFTDACGDTYIVVNEEQIHGDAPPAIELYVMEYKVDRKTVGQWTGFQDTDSQDIYEDDIVEWWIFLFNLDLPEDRKQIRIRDTVVFFDGVFRLATRGEILANKLNPLCELRRIGNTHDNPELLERSHA